MEREWIRVLGHREVPGRPALYGTTREFLDYFGLKSLEGLPPLAEIRDLDQVEPDLFAPAPAQIEIGDDGAGGVADSPSPVHDGDTARDGEGMASLAQTGQSGGGDEHAGSASGDKHGHT
jgi:segregation and condensation protein B